MPRRRLIGCRIAVMPRTKVLTAAWITLLALARCVERIVQRHLLALIKVTFLGEGGFQLYEVSLTGLKSSAI